jgi:hypothetical protein
VNRYKASAPNIVERNRYIKGTKILVQQYRKGTSESKEHIRCLRLKAMLTLPSAIYWWGASDVEPEV